MPELVQTRDLITRTATVRAETVDEAARSVEAVLATEARVTVFDWARFEAIDEILLARGAELPDQMVLLEDHNQWGIRYVHGSIREMRIENNQVIGRLHFAANAGEETERAWQMVMQKHLRDVSIGYRAKAFVDIQPGESAEVEGQRYEAGQRVLRISTAWRPKEGSVVVIGADEAAKIRGQMMGLPQPQRAPLPGSTRCPKCTATRGELADTLNDLVDEMVDDDMPRDDVIADLAEAADVSEGTVNQILAGDVECPPLERLEGFAAVLGVEVDQLIDMAIEDGCSPDQYGREDDDEDN